MMRLDDEEEVSRETLPPDVVDHLIRTYPDRFADIAAQRRDALDKFDKENEIGGGKRFLAGISGALTGRSPQALLDKVRGDIAAKRSKLSEGFKADEDALRGGLDLENDALNREKNIFSFGRAKKDAETDDATRAREEDPTSAESKMAQELARAMGYKGKIETLTASQFKAFSPALEKKYTVEQNRLARQDSKRASDADAEARRHERKIKADQDLTDKLYKRTQNGVLGKLNEMRTMANAAKANIDEFSKNPTGYSDYGTLMTSLKSLQGDTSVVREAEVRLGTNATSLINKVGNYLQQAANGKSLQPEQRKQIIQVMSALTQGYEAAYRKAAAPTVIMAKNNGIPLEEVFDDPEGIDPPAPTGKVRVTDGNETLEIDAEDLADAKKDGFKEVGR